MSFGKKQLKEFFKKAVSNTTNTALMVAGKAYMSYLELTHKTEEQPPSKISLEIEKLEAQEEAEISRDVTQYLLNHPAAGNSSAFNDIWLGRPLYDDKTSRAALGISDVLRGIELSVSSMDTDRIELTKDMPFFTRGRGYGDDDARAMWAWVYALASTGEAPHLIPGFVIETGADKITARLDASFAGLDITERHDRIVNLWREDKEAAVQKRAQAPKGKPPVP